MRVERLKTIPRFSEVPDDEWFTIGPRKSGRMSWVPVCVEVCRIDVAHSSVPVMAQMSDRNDVFWVRMNNSTRAVPENEADEYVKDGWG